MSPADFDHSNSNSDGRDTSVPIPPPAPPGSAHPPIRHPHVPPAVPSQRDSVPPATMPPKSGFESAKGGRWRGEIDRIADQAEHPADGPGDEDDELAKPERVAREAPPWLVSLVIHLILLLTLALVSSPAGRSLGTVMLTLGESQNESPVELVEFSVAEVEVSDTGEMLEATEPEAVQVFETAELSEVEAIAATEAGNGVELAISKPMFHGRTGAMRDTLLELYGGTAETQEAVKLGLAWLKRQQTRDGSWSLLGGYRDGGITESRVAATSMALLAFLGDGHTHQEGQYADVVRKGMRYLVKQQDRQGFFAHYGFRNGRMYAQAQATIAICELYGMTKDSWLRDRAQLAINFAVESQSSEGGWRYAPRDGSDTSVTGWFVMALKSGEAAGLDVDGYAFVNVERYLNSVQSFDGAAYAYQPYKDPDPVMTAEGLLCRQYLGWQRDHRPLQLGIEALLLDSPFDLDDQNVYYWYYATQVLHHYGGQPWQKWNNVMRDQLPKAQVKRGNEIGSWAPQRDQWGDSAGRLYTTCLSLYCLEVYYRHMPLYQVGQ